MYRLLSIFLILFTVHVSIAQTTDTFHYFLDGRQKLTVKQGGAFYHGKVYKKHATDFVWKVDEYTVPDNNLYSTGWAKDDQGTIKHGSFMYFNADQVKIREGNYVDGKREGEWQEWQAHGKILRKYMFHHGMPVGLRKSWYENGSIRDSAFLDNGGNGHAIAYFESGLIRYQGDVAAGLRSGTWEYYYELPGNIKSMEVNYTADSMISNKCFTEKGEPQNENCYYNKSASFPGGEKAWRDWLRYKIEGVLFANQVEISRDYKVTMSFGIDKDGKTIDIKVYRSGGNAKLDKLAEKIIADSPSWEPGMQSNQPSATLRRQPITFMANMNN